MPVTVGFDIDGVLADFTEMFYSVAKKGRWTNGHQQGWDFDLPEARVEEAWRNIKANPNFWGACHPLFTEPERRAFTQMVDLGLIFPIYITNRPKEARGATIDWLSRVSLPNPHALIITDDKADVVKRHAVEFMLEDSPKNIEAMQEKAVVLAIRDWPYNRHLSPSILRVSSVGEYLAVVARMENL